MTPTHSGHLREASSLILGTYNQTIEITDTHVVAGIVDGRLEVKVWNVSWSCWAHIKRAAIWDGYNVTR